MIVELEVVPASQFMVRPNRFVAVYLLSVHPTTSTNRKRIDFCSIENIIDCISSHADVILPINIGTEWVSKRGEGDRAEFKCLAWIPSLYSWRLQLQDKHKKYSITFCLFLKRIWMNNALLMQTKCEMRRIRQIVLLRQSKGSGLVWTLCWDWNPQFYTLCKLARSMDRFTADSWKFYHLVKA